MPISQQTVGGNSCGACATSYIAQELRNNVIGLAKIKALYTEAQFDSKKGHKEIIIGSGVYYDYIDPTKLCTLIEKKFNLKCTAYRTRNSILNKLDPLLEYSSVIKSGEGLNLIKNGKKLAIGIYDNGAGMHYIATKFDSGRYWIKDSNAKFPKYESAPFFIMENKGFISDLNYSGNPHSTITNTNSYKYLGACLVVN